MNGEEIEAAVAAIGRSRKYQDLCPETVREVLTVEAGRHRSFKDALPHARRRLHRLWASFLGEPDYGDAADALTAAFATGDDGAVRGVCGRLMGEHASSAERLPELPCFYQAIWERTGAPARVADLACALNPLSFRWMALPQTVAYHAFDINRRTVDLVNHYFRLEGLEALAEWRDVLCTPPTTAVDVALLFKMYHCLEHRRKGAGWAAVESAPARWVAVSFPTRNLREQTVDIRGNYEPTIRANLAQRGWRVEEVSFASEVVLLIQKADPASGAA